MSLQENKEVNDTSENNDEGTKKSSGPGTNGNAYSTENPDAFSEFNDSDTNFRSLSDDVSEAEVLTPDQQKIAELENELASVQAKLTETHQKMLRIAADADNTRKRLEREKFDARVYAIQEFAKDLLPVIDSFEKALQLNESSSSEFQPGSDQSNGMAEGVKLVSKIFQDAIKKHGIERLPGKDSPFNPIYHNAIAKEVDGKYKSETVAEEFMAGYKIGERILRTALVKVGVPD